MINQCQVLGSSGLHFVLLLNMWIPPAVNPFAFCILVLGITGLFFPHNDQLFLNLLFTLNVFNAFLILVSLILLSNVHPATFL